MTADKGRTRKILLVAAIFLLAAFSLALFHHHADGQHALDCPVCRLIGQFALALGLIVIALILGLLKSSAFRPAYFKKLNSFLSANELQNRAPPVLPKM